MAVVALLAFFVFLVWQVPKRQVATLSAIRNLDAKESFDLENEARKTLAQILGGILLLVGIVSTVATLSVSQRNLALSEQGQITDRFTKAVDQLGAVDAAGKKKLEIRLGAIYALERIAKDSPRDHWPVMEVLSAYVRMNALPQSGQEEEAARDDRPSPDKPEVDIKAVMNVFARRRATYGTTEDQPLDLTKANLQSFVLGNWVSKADYRGVLWGQANLRWAQIHEADFRESEFHDADLRNVHFRGADLRGAHLVKADLSHAFLQHALFRGARLHDAKFRHADLHGADLSGAIGLKQEQINEAEGDIATKLPEGLERPAHWPTKPKE